ncbi:MAG: diacylglycerol kinase family protein [Candidatus Paceibacterota bacterium]|jgi:undecaprenol kinase/diacylglycerol kinase (ATP)
MNHKLAKSFTYAINGLRTCWNDEANFKIEVFLGLLSIITAFFLQIKTIEFAVVFITITIVLAVEILNTAFEELCDKLRPENDPYVAKIKDLAAAAVLISSMGAVAIGIFIFGPYILGLNL